VVVVMRDGYGLHGATGAVAGDQSPLSGLSPPGADLGSAIVGAIEHLAAASGSTLPVGGATAPATTGSPTTIPWIVFGVGLVSWIVFWVGLVFILLAWGTSLRARPWQRTKRLKGGAT
jgi:hypothetical protein